ncbi:MAG: head GIN domain-containing protein [Bacteroidales bacterium]
MKNSRQDFPGTGIVIMLSFVFLIACVSVEAQKQKRDVSDFTEISYSLPGTLEIVQSDDVSLAIEGDDDDLERIITKVDGNKLKIYTKHGSSGLNNVKVFVHVRELEEISGAGSGDIIIRSKFKGGELEVNLSGSGNFKGEEIVCRNFDLDIAGSGDAYLGGVVDGEIDFDIAGSGSIKAENMKAGTADISIAGSGSAKVWVTERLETNIVGSGDVYYKGNPLVDAEAIGSGRTRPID